MISTSQEEIFKILNNPEDFKKFMEFFNDNSHFMGDYPEDGYFYRPIAETLEEAINLFLNPDKAKEKHQKLQEEFDSQNDYLFEKGEERFCNDYELSDEEMDALDKRMKELYADAEELERTL